MRLRYEISKQRISSDKGSIFFTISFSGDLISASITRAAVTAMDGVGRRNILLVFNDKLDAIAIAAFRKLTSNPYAGVISLGLNDFQH